MSEELLIRWIQVNTFLPAMQFSQPPWLFGESSPAVSAARKAVQLHTEHAPTIIALAQRAKYGEPIIRPMWWAEPEDERTYRIDNQFLLGDDILVAPVVVPQGPHQRQVYLPSGIWIDQEGKEHQGPVEITMLTPLEVLPYFKRKH